MCTHPVVYKKLKEHVDTHCTRHSPTLDNFEALSYVRAVVKEGLRLSMAAWCQSHVLSDCLPLPSAGGPLQQEVGTNAFFTYLRVESYHCYQQVFRTWVFPRRMMNTWATVFPQVAQSFPITGEQDRQVFRGLDECISWLLLQWPISSPRAGECHLTRSTFRIQMSSSPRDGYPGEATRTTISWI